MLWRNVSVFSFFLCGVFFFPHNVARAATCSSQGYTVVFVNGILTTEEQAKSGASELQRYLGYSYKSEPLNVQVGYNPSHVGGLGDLLQTVAQSFGASISDFDRDTILLQIHPEVTTRKMFLVGHSQGTLYTNEIYKYLVSNGEPKASVGVYNVATPANYVAGGGTYLTSKADFIIKSYADYARGAGALPPLPANTQLDPGAAVGDGHSFVDVYLTYAGDRVVQDIQQGLSRLKPEEGIAAEGCFTPPEKNIGYKTKQALFAVLDPTAVGLKVGAVTGAKIAVATVGGVGGGLATVGSFFGSVANAFIPEPRTENLPGSHNIVGALYGSSLTEENLNDLLGSSQGGAVALAIQKPQSTSASESATPESNGGGDVLGVETEGSETPAEEPLIPQPKAIGLASPGFGGGDSSSVEQDPATEPDETPEESPEVAVPAAPSDALARSSLFGEQLDHSAVDGVPAHSLQSFTPASSGTIRSACVWADIPVPDAYFNIYFTTEPPGAELYGDQTYLFDADGPKEYCFTFSGIQDGYPVRAGTVYNLSLYPQTGSALFYGSAADSYSGGAANQNGLQGTVKDYYFRFSDTGVSSEGPPVVASVAVGGGVVTAATAPFLATTTEPVSLIITFSEDLSVAPQVSVGGTQSVQDCSDSNLRTFCVTYVPPNDTEDDARLLQINGAAGASDQMLKTTYRFITIDTKAPVVQGLPASSQVQEFASTTPVSFNYWVTDGTPVDVRCSFDDDLLAGCGTNTTVFPPQPLEVGDHVFTLEARDRYGHTSAVVRHFKVLP